jgi:small-conductance mechanosensitive channel
MDSILQDLLSHTGENPFVHAAVLVAAAILLAVITDQVISRVLKVWARRSSTDLDDRLIQVLHRPVFLTVLIAGLYLALLQLDLQPKALERFQQVLMTIIVVVWLVFAFRASSIMLELLSRLEKKFTAIQPNTVTLFDQVFKIVLAGAAVYFLFLIWGVDVGAWLAGAGIVGIAVGFAAKDTLANVFSGLFILADAPYHLDDFVVLDSGERGEVTHIGLRSTRLLTRDDIEITIPNAVMANAKILNESGGRWQKERIRVKVGVAYGSDIDRVEEVLLSAAQNHPEIDHEPAPRVRFRSFGDSGLQFELMGWIHEPVLRGRVLHELNSAVYKSFAAAGIEIPYPKHDVYLHPQPGSLSGGNS